MHAEQLRVWRDHDDAARRVGPVMRLDPSAAADPRLFARDVFGSGGRLVVIDEPIDFGALGADKTTSFLTLLRELTAWGVAVDWRLRITDDTGRKWHDLWHLAPPSQVTAPLPLDPALEFWQRQFCFGLCVMRQGPGIIEVRDRRAGQLRISRFTDPPQLAAVEHLERGVPATSVDPGVLAGFGAARVVAAEGDLRLWLPCRAVRSTLSPAAFW
jgi:hypothetical protein